MSEVLSTILTLTRNMLEQPSEDKWRAYQAHLSRFAKGLHSELPELIDMIEEYRQISGSMPTIAALLLETNNPKDEKLHRLVQEVATKNQVQADAAVFIASARTQETLLLQEAVGLAQREAGLILTPARLSNPKQIEESCTDAIQAFNRVKDLANREREATSVFAVGHEATRAQQDRIEEEEKIIKAGGLIRYDNGIEHFRNTVQIRPGDLYIVGGFTSHGKSIELRRLAYYLQTTCCLNVYFLTFELTDKEILDLMLLRHANNKIIFPNTPQIATKPDFDMRVWTDAQKRFYHDVVVPDYFNNNRYGICKFNYPGKARYGMTDLRVDMMETERQQMPIDVCVIDFATKMWPLPPDARGQPTTADFNQQFSDLKQFALNYHDVKGMKRPIPVITAAQISRGGLEEAQKNELRYEESAFSHYSEIERSADTLMTVMMTNDMRDQGQCRHQQIKGRKTGVTTEPVDMRLDINNGEQLSALTGFTQEQLQDALSTLF